MSEAKIDRGTILLVEDDAGVAELERRSLERAGYTVRPALSVDEAVAILGKETISAVVLDYRLGVGASWPVLDAAQNLTPKVPGILVTAMGDERVAAEAIHRGASEYLIKTGDFVDRLPGLVDRVLRRGAAERTNASIASIVESSEDGILSQTLDGIVRTWNKGAERIYGYTSAEMVGSHVRILFPPERLNEEVLFIEKAKCKESIAQFETVRRWKDGRPITVSLTVSPILDSGGTVIGVSKVVRDITVRKGADEALRLSESRFRRIVEAPMIGIIFWDLQGNITDANDAFLGMVGYTRDDLRSGKLRWKEMTPPQFEPVDRKAVLEITQTGSCIPFEKEYIGKDGAVVPVLMGGTLLEGSKQQGVSFVINLAEKRRIEAALTEKSRLVALVADVGTAHTCEQDVDAVFRQCTEAVVEHLDAAVARIWVLKTDENALELRASSGLFADLLLPHSLIPVGRGEIGIIAQTRLPHSTNDIPNDPTTLSARAWARREGLTGFAGYPILVDGVLAGVLAMYSKKPLGKATLRPLQAIVNTVALGIKQRHSEGERARLEEELRQSHKMEAIGRLAGGIAHDFNNLLSVINGYSQLTLATLDKRDPLYKDIEEIEKAGTRAAGLTRQLLAFSRKQLLQSVPLNLNQIVTDIEKLLTRLIGEHIDLVKVLSPLLGTVRADPGQVEQIVVNLAVNARDAMPKGGQLVLETSNVEWSEADALQHAFIPAGRYALLTVSDTGSGMTDEVKAHIFEPFFTTKDLGKGTGLGLSTVYGIVKQSKGHILVTSELGRGTTFKIYLPCVPEPAEHVSRAPDEASATRGTETILIVEDQEAVRSVVGAVLRSGGYTVLEAAQGSEALQLFESKGGSIDLVISDIVMPQMSGPDLLRRLAVMKPGVKALFMSGYTSGLLTQKEDWGPDTLFIEKPFAPETFLRKVRGALDAPPKSKGQAATENEHPAVIGT